MAASSFIIDEPGTGRCEVFPLPVAEDFLFPLLHGLFTEAWDKIVFGTLVQGAVFEIRAPNPPTRISLFDGYLTVNFGAWHFHVCIGETKGSRRLPTPDEVARHRRTARAELYRSLNPDGAPRSWGLRLYNGRDENQLTVFLPNPMLGDDDSILKVPDWSRLALWDQLRQDLLGLPPDPLDRRGGGFPCVG